MCGLWWCAGVLALLAAGACGGGGGGEGGGGSLRGALEALQRRQRSRVDPPRSLLYTDTDPNPTLYRLYGPVPALYEDEPYDLSDEEIPERVPEKYIIKYLNEEPSQKKYIKIKKKKVHSEREHKQSAFRERDHKREEDERLEKLFAERGEETENKQAEVKHDNDAEYAMLLNKLWSKYKSRRLNPIQENNNVYTERKIQKRQYPDDDGWGPVAFKRKRSTSENENNGGNEDYPTLEYPLQQNDRYKYTIDEQQPSAEPDADEHDDYIAFEPLDNDKLELPTDGDDYSYDTLVKSFPVTKRGSGSYQNVLKKRSLNKNSQKKFRSGSGTDPKVISDLSKIFGEPGSDSIKSPVKRSYKNEDSHETKPPQITGVPHDNDHNHNESHVHDDGSHEHQGHGMHPPVVTGKEEVAPDEHAHQHPISLKKKSIDWSQYFGIDKRKKKSMSFRSETDNRFVKQYEDIFNRELGLASHKKVKRSFTDDKPIDESEFEIDQASIAIRSERKRNAERRNESKLDNIDRKLAGVESVILDDALHASNVGELDSKEEQQLKENMLSRLAAAYNLEKMRKALKDFKKTLNSRQDPKEINQNAEKSKEKRIAVKKEKAELKQEDVFPSQATKVMSNSIAEDFESEQGAGHYVDGSIDEPFSEGYMGGSGTHGAPLQYPGVGGSDCPVLEQIVRRCRSIDLLAGDRGQLFLPLCSLHQICYLCGASGPTTCDLVFVSEGDAACGGDGACSRAARAALMALRELHEPLAERADGCEPCLARALGAAAGTT